MRAVFRHAPTALLVASVALIGGCEKNTTPEPKAEVPKDDVPAAEANRKPPEPTTGVPDSGSSTGRASNPNAPAGPPTRTASRAEIESTISKLSADLKQGASAPDNPWALAHGLAAFGPTLAARDGRLAIDVIVSDFARLETIGKKKVYGFPTHAASERLVDPNDPMKRLQIPVEPHPDLLVKAIVDAGVPLSRKFRIGKKRVSLQRLVDDAAWAFTLPKTDEEWHKFAWSASLFLRAYGPEGLVKTHAGDFTVHSLIRKAVQRLEKDQAFLLQAFKAKRPDLVQKRKQGIFAHTCGGLHFVQAAVVGAGRTDEKSDEFRMKRQLELVEFRWDAERRIYRKMIRTQPKYRFLLLVQELKFHGHVLETLAMAQEAGIITADEGHRRLAGQVAGDLIDAVNELAPLFEAQAGLEKSAPQSYFDLIGDGCHAVRGLRRVLTAFYPSRKTP